MTIALPHRRPWGEPLTPANASQDPEETGKVRSNKNFWKSIYQAITTYEWWLQLTASAFGLSLFNILCVNLPLILCPMGFSLKFSTILCLVIVICSGIITSIVTGRYLEFFPYDIMVILKIYVVLFIFGSYMSSYCDSQAYEYPGTVMALVYFGCFSIPILPLAYESAVECIFPVSEATSAGLIWICGNICSIIYQNIFKAMAQPIPSDWYILNQCQGFPNTSSDKWYQNALFTLTSITSGLSIIWLIFYICPFRRSKYSKMKVKQT